ncbi:putative Caveolin-1 [Hypsibius exemplaris]|uniref:Caveolin n=1 Tax=Hypsibius exemplaris TaxID=2072580 RepID=A0A1W0WUS4_HYPEX|nr:putative Caveolin-1 [Hypsibius exemplaris]
MDDPKSIENIELRDAEVPIIAGQGDTIQVTETITTTETTKPKKIKHVKVKKEGADQPLSFGLNVWDRDEKSINGQVHIMFDDVLAEPTGAHSFEPVWRGTFVLFDYTKVWVYRFLTAIFAWPLAFIWGILFAVAAAFNNFIFAPFFKIFCLIFFWFGRVWGTLFRQVFDPIFESIGRCFSGIRFSRGEYTNVGTNTNKCPVGVVVENPTGCGNGNISMA